MPLLVVAATLAATSTIVVAQPIRSPWWTYADADASYTGAGLNLLRGTSIRYLDHPGLPLEELIATVFGAEHAVDRVRGSSQSTAAFVDQRMLNLDDAKGTWRTLAIAIYFLGGLVSCLLAARLFRSWLFGLAGGLLWLGSPGLAAMSIQYRPDVVLGIFVVVATYLLGRAAEIRSATTYAAAAMTIGLAMMVKMHAAGLLVALSILAVARPPQPGWAAGARSRFTGRLRRHRRVAFGVVAAWVALAVYLNRDFGSYDFTLAQVLALVVPLGVVSSYAYIAMKTSAKRTRRVFSPFYAFLAAGVLVGLVLPITLDVPDGLTSLIHIREGLLGGGINTGVPPFATPLHQLIEPPLREALVVFIVAGAAAVVGLRRRDPLPGAWFAAAAVLAVMAQARQADVHYFAPAYLVSIFGAFWLIRAIDLRAFGWLALALVVAYVTVPQFQHRGAPTHLTEQVVADYQPQMREVAALLRPGQVALAPPTWPDGSDWYSYVVQPVVNYTPRYPYTFVEADTRGAGEAEEQGLRLAYYTGPGIPQTTGITTMQIGDIGWFRVRVISPTEVRLLSGPGT